MVEPSSWSINWFAPITAIRVESKKLSKFILPTIGILLIKPILCTIYGLFLLVIHIKPTSDNELVQIPRQINWDRLHALNSTAILSTYLQEGLHPRSLLQSQKSRWISRKDMIRWTLQRTFNMIVLAMYSLSFFAQLYEVIDIDLPSTEEFYYITYPLKIRFTYTYISCATAGVKHY